MSRILHHLVFFVYLVFSQFVIKAWITIDRSLIGSEDFCVIKKLDAFDGKYSCRSNNNIADMGAVFDDSIPFVFYDSGYIPTVLEKIQYDTLYDEQLLYAHSPPDNYIQQYFIETYIGITLLLS